MASSRPDLIIAGGGLAGCLAALALSRRRPDVRFLLVEQEETFGGNHIWSFFDTDVLPLDRALLEPLGPLHWPDHDIRFPGRMRAIGIGYNSVSSSNLDQAVRDAVAPEHYRLGDRIEEVGRTHVMVGGERIEADGIIDARGAGPNPSLSLAWQKFVGRTYAFARPHGMERPIIMDGTVDQRDGYRFVYSLPISDQELLIEDTYYSSSEALDPEQLGEGLDRMASRRGTFERTGEEKGILPIVLDGEIEALWPDEDPPVARLGMRGGFFHPTTGYSLPDAVRNAAILCEQADLGSDALHAHFRDRARGLWRERRFFRMLNRMMFHAAEPGQRYRVLEHFYRLPAPLIARFYAAKLTVIDKLRILSGRPPVPVARALSAIRSKAA